MASGFSCYTFWASWRVGRGAWLQHVEDTGIWAEPVNAFGLPKARIALSFITDSLTQIEKRTNRGLSFLRCYYTNRSSQKSRVLDMAYIPDEKNLVDNELIPFLQSKVKTTPKLDTGK